MADPKPFDDDLVIAYPWTASLLVDEMEDHGQLIVRGPEAAQLAALAALQDRFGDREVGARPVHQGAGMELTVIVSNPGWSGRHQCAMVPVAVARQREEQPEQAGQTPAQEEMPATQVPRQAPGEFRTSLMLDGWNNSTFGWDGPAASYFAVLEPDDGRDPVWLSGVRVPYSTLNALIFAIAQTTGVSAALVIQQITAELADAHIDWRMLR